MELFLINIGSLLWSGSSGKWVVSFVIFLIGSFGLKFVYFEWCYDVCDGWFYVVGKCESWRKVVKSFFCDVYC